MTYKSMKKGTQAKKRGYHLAIDS